MDNKLKGVAELKSQKKKNNQLVSFIKSKLLNSKFITAYIIAFLAVLLPYVLLLTSTTDFINTFDCIATLAIGAGFVSGIKSSGFKFSPAQKVKLRIAAFYSVPFVLALGTTAQLSLHFIHNLFLISAVYFFFIVIFGNNFISSIITSAFFTVASLAAQYLYVVKGNVIRFSDVYALKTALTVTGEYGLRFDGYMYCILAMGIVSVVISGLFKFKSHEEMPLPFLKKLNLKMTAIKNRLQAVCLMLLFCFISVADIALVKSERSWQSSLEDSHYGAVYNVLTDMANNTIAPPSGYTKEKAEEILARYTGEDDVSEEALGDVNIIVVMNESFADISKFVDVPVENYMPFVSSLKNNTTNATVGKMIACCYAGGTANVEFEAITGFSNAFLPDGVYPYLQYIKSDINSSLRSLPYNYIKTYTHPYLASNYDRNVVFSRLGFNHFNDGTYFESGVSYENRPNVGEMAEKNQKNLHTLYGTLYALYDGVDLVRNYISDKAVYDDIISRYEKKDKSERLMEYVVTMQNHSPYDKELDDENYYELLCEDNSAVNQFLYLLKLSDNSFKELCEYFSKADEKIIILFFGDHQPCMKLFDIKSSLDGRIQEGEKLEGSKDNLMTMFSTPFVIWTNYETEAEEIEYVSTNYFPVLIKDRAKIEKSPYEKFLTECYKEYPVISVYGVIDKDGQYYLPEDLKDNELIKEYQYLQYYYMFDN